MALQIESEERPADGHVRRIKDLSLFFFGILVLSTVIGYSLTVLVADCVAEEDRRWATSTLACWAG
ncbi:hypothetical protein CDN99_19735 [Roseateles aquatilis]|uniref:Uncharacterized protein n=2 Tax=Roseateles aquatilis TaxID=431061 RepID=A0A246J2X4_9BURK|nr:hypothetical protein CDN99_19735 [Roseateles aquatilis]